MSAAGERARERDQSEVECKAPPGAWQPKVNLARCEAKADCVEVCPFDVFAIGPVPDAAYRAQPWFTRAKLWVHGRKTALTPNADACRACGLCVRACPERAITLVRA